MRRRARPAGIFRLDVPVDRRYKTKCRLATRREKSGPPLLILEARAAENQASIHSRPLENGGILARYYTGLSAKKTLAVFRNPTGRRDPRPRPSRGSLPSRDPTSADQQRRMAQSVLSEAFSDACNAFNSAHASVRRAG